MSTQMLRYGRWLAILAFMGAAIWLAFWHHSDGLKAIYIVAVVIPMAINAWLAYLIKSREGK